jgi:hypothetical protein
MAGVVIQGYDASSLFINALADGRAASSCRAVKEWPRGGIGRRAGFRFLYSQGCSGSTPDGATT